MKFSLSLLQKHLKGDYTKDDVAHALVAIGLEVEEVIDEGARLKDFIIAHIDSTAKHPDADRLQICQVNTGSEILNIVCGGKNARAGITVALARVGIVIPSTGQALKLGKVRGVESQGMLCSADELLLDAISYGPLEGIMEVETDLPPGSLLSHALNLKDVIFDISITPNRADCFALYGIARDLFAYFSYTGKKVELVPYGMSEIKRTSKSSPKVINQATEACYAFHLTRVEGVGNGESPSWMRQSLAGFGLRPISALVDITNYLCFDLGRPLHVFDADKVRGDLTLRYARVGETLDALDDKAYTLDEGMLVICDEGGIISLAGIMGGKCTAVDENTKNVLLESAWFDAVNIATTGQRLNLISDARMRFERGIDPSVVERGSIRALNLIQEICGGNVFETTTTISKNYTRETVTLSFERLQKLIGEEISPKESEKILNLLGFETLKSDAHSLTVFVPSWRVDVGEQADLIEEIVRMRGVDHIAALPMPISNPVERTLTPSKMAATILTNRGYHEAVTFSFLNREQAKLFQGESDLITIENPISSDLTTMRPSVVSTLLQAASSNLAKGREGVSLFESGHMYGHRFKEKQAPVIACLDMGVVSPSTWQRKEILADAHMIKERLFDVLSAVGIEEKNIQITREAPIYYHPGQSGCVKQGNRVIAYFGALHPSVLKSFDITKTTVAFEIMVESLPQKQKRPVVKTLSTLQSVTRDFAFVVDKTYEAGKLSNILWNKLSRQQGFPKMVTLEDVRIFDLFDQFKEEGMESKKSIAFSITFQPEEQTLNEEDLTQFMQSVTTLVEKETGGTLRQ